ncbi:MAG: hypothetical protein WCJ60_01295 [bacterium]
MSHLKTSLSYTVKANEQNSNSTNKGTISCERSKICGSWLTLVAELNTFDWGNNDAKCNYSTQITAIGCSVCKLSSINHPEYINEIPNSEPVINTNLGTVDNITSAKDIAYNLIQDDIILDHTVKLLNFIKNK